MDWSQWDAIIFDLDGTLYEDTDHFAYFSQRLADKLPEANRSAYLEDEAAAKQGRHVLRMGRVYDRRRDLVVEATPEGRVQRAWDWQGEELDERQRRRFYSDPVAFDMQWMISIGDHWWIPTACAYHHGVDSTYDAYLAAKDYLASDAASLTPIPGVKEGLAGLRESTQLVVATNSDLADTKRILNHLGLTDIVHAVYPDSRKPQCSKAVLQRIMAELDLAPQRCLAVGDNYLNDVYPAAQLGMGTCLIDPYGLYGSAHADILVSSLGSVFR